MIFGFNSDVIVGAESFHVQTEDRASPQSVIETLVYCRGRIVHRQATNYSDLVGTPAFDEENLRQRVERQHREVIDHLRSGAISDPTNSTDAQLASADGIRVRLRNASSWLSGGNASLDVEVLYRSSEKPVAEVSVEAHLEGAKQTASFAAVTGSDGRAQFQFPLPPLGSSGAELVIRAGKGSAEDEIRYALRPRPKPAPPKP